MQNKVNSRVQDKTWEKFFSKSRSKLKLTFYQIDQLRQSRQYMSREHYFLPFFCFCVRLAWDCRNYTMRTFLSACDFLIYGGLSEIRTKYKIKGFLFNSLFKKWRAYVKEAKKWIQRFNKTPIVEVHWAAERAFLSQGWIVTSTVMNKNRPDSLKKQETSSIIFNWDISTMLRRSSDFVNHSYDYRPNWTPISPVTITYIDDIDWFPINGNYGD